MQKFVSGQTFLKSKFYIKYILIFTNHFINNLRPACNRQPGGLVLGPQLMNVSVPKICIHIH